MELTYKNKVETGKMPAKTAYTTPAIIYESNITTRAGSPFAVPDDNTDPANLFGNS